MNFRSLALLALGTAFLPLQAQQRTHIGFQLQAYLRTTPAEKGVDLFLRGDAADLTRAVLAHRGTVRQVTKGWALARVPAAEVAALDKEPAVLGIEFNLYPGHVMNDSMRVKARVQPIHEGLAPLLQPYTGEGVIMGIVDTGLDWSHPDFKTALGNTRVIKYWDQNYLFDPDRTPMAYGYGQEWDADDIDAGFCTATDPLNQFGHGTTVAGTATGNGFGNDHHQGVAPDADIIIVSNELGAANWSTTVVDAVRYIFDEADALGRPAVVNLSLGNYFGSHDGLDPATLMIKDMLQATPGRTVVCAAGNSGALAPYHLGTDVTADTSFTWFRYGSFVPVAGSGVYFELWADTADMANVRYSVGVDRRNPTYAFRGRVPFRSIQGTVGQVVSDTLRSFSGSLLGVVNTFAEVRDAQYHMEVFVTNADSADNYYYRFMSTGDGRFDVWSTSALGTSEIVASVPTVGQFPAIAHYVLPDTRMTIVDAWACSPEVITVGNYYNEQVYTDMNGNLQNLGNTEGTISANSSRGPSRTGLVKPDVAAPGDITFSPGPLAFIQQLINANQAFKIAPGGLHLRGGGTSIASPVVAGTAALYFEKCPRATHLEVRDAIIASAFGDALTGTLPNERFGHGRVDAFGALVLSNVEVPITGPTAVCDGDSVLLEGPAGMSTYLWNSGGEGASTYSQGGEVMLYVQDQAGCAGLSGAVNVDVLPLPQAPVVDVNGSVVTCSLTADGYQWFRESVEVPGATAQSYTVTVSGNYSVEVRDGNGCSARSAPVFVSSTGIASYAHASIRLWPVPATDELWVERADAARPMGVEVLDTRGARVPCAWTWSAGRVRLDVAGLAAGQYAVRVVGDGAADVFRFVKR